MIANSNVLSKLDYWNSVLAGVSQSNVQKLQRVQNFAALVVCNAKRRDNSLPLLSKLHWLPVSFRINFKIALTVFKIISTGQPTYLQILLSLYAPVRQLRSSATNNLVVPLVKTKLHSRAFKMYALTLWNSLPAAIKTLFTSMSLLTPSNVL